MELLWSWLISSYLDFEYFILISSLSMCMCMVIFLHRQPFDSNQSIGFEVLAWFVEINCDVVEMGKKQERSLAFTCSWIQHDFNNWTWCSSTFVFQFFFNFLLYLFGFRFSKKTRSFSNLIHWIPRSSSIKKKLLDGFNSENKNKKKHQAAVLHGLWSHAAILACA